MRKVGIITFLVSLLVFSGVFAASNMLLPKAVPKVQEEVITDEDLGEGNVIEQIVDDELLFLVVGLDEVTQQRWSRTDTLILVHADLATGEIHLISIPRDTRVFIDDEHGNDKINHANAYGGILKTMRTVRNFLGIDLDYYVEFDFEAVKHVVDAVGGVDVNVTVPIRTWPPNNPDVDLRPGWQRVNGEEALMFARFRKGYEDGDIGRLNAQQHLIVQMVKEMLKARNIVRLPQLLDIYFEEIGTNLDLGKVRELIPLAGRFSGDNIKRTYIPGTSTEIDDVYFYEYDRDATQKIVDEYLSDYKIEPVAEIREYEETEPYTEYTEDVWEEPYEEYTEAYYEEEYTESYEEPYEEEYYEEEYYEEEDTYEDSYDDSGEWDEETSDEWDE